MLVTPRKLTSVLHSSAVAGAPRSATLCRPTSSGTVPGGPCWSPLTACPTAIRSRPPLRPSGVRTFATGRICATWACEASALLRAGKYLLIFFCNYLSLYSSASNQLKSPTHRHHCYCGNSLVNEQVVDPSECNWTCHGDTCGGRHAVTIYDSGPAGPQHSIEVVSRWDHHGCYTDMAPPDRTLSGMHTTSDDMTASRCANICEGQDSRLFGVENGNECFCGNTIDASRLTSPDECTVFCAGDDRYVSLSKPHFLNKPDEYADPDQTLKLCGGGWRINGKASPIPHIHLEPARR
jgi:hypothetical protein